MKSFFRGILLVVWVCLLMVFVCGCAAIPIGTSEIRRDFAKNILPSLGDDVELKEFKLIHRESDREKKTDMVSVFVEIDHPNATARQFYTMSYTYSHGRWVLDTVLPDTDEDAMWETIAKSKPTKEEVYEALAKASREAMDAWDKESLTEDAGGYFFDENCSITILEDEMTCKTDGTPVYTASVFAKRVWKYVDVAEIQKARFEFNTQDFEWELVDYVIENAIGNWHVDGEYQGRYGYTFEITTGNSISIRNGLRYDGSDVALANYTEAVCTITTRKGMVCTKRDVKLYLPCSKGIPIEYVGFELDDQPYESLFVSFVVFPDRISCVMSSSDYYIEMDIA